jgi:PAS domain S-box-containing protein
VYHILYVDDEPDLLKTGKSFLELDGEFVVDTYTSASSCLSLLPFTNYDAIIADYQMPGLDGIEFLKKVRASGTRIPFILFTGRGREDVAIQALNAGADFYLQKGGDPDVQYTQLAHQVRQSIRQRRAEASLRESEERFSTMLQHVPSIAVQGYRMDGTTHYWNEASENIYGYTAEEAIGRNLVDLIIPPEMRDEVRKAIAYMSQTGQPIPASELSLMRKDGSRVAVFSSHAVIRKSDGELELFCIDIDLTGRKKTEEALQESEERFRILSEAALEGIMIHDRGVISDCNSRFAALFGYRPEEIIGRTGFEHLVTPDSRDTITRWNADGARGTVDITGIRKDGTQFFGEMASAGILWQGRPHTIVQVHDITSRKEGEWILLKQKEELNAAYGHLAAVEGELRRQYDLLAENENALREREDRFRTIFENSPYPISLNSIPGGKFLEVNSAFLRSSGYWESELIGKNPAEVGMISLMDLARLTSHFLVSGKIENVPLVIVGKEGRRVHVVFSTIPVTINNRAAVLTMAAEITKLKRVEEALLESEARFNKLARQINTVTWEVDARGLYTYVSEVSEAAWGYRPDELQGKVHCYDLHPESGHEAFRVATLAVFERNEPIRDLENPVRAKDGHIVWVSTNGIPLLNADGSLRGYQGNDTDITKRKLAEDRIRAALAEKEILLREVHHRVKNNFAGIIALISLQKSSLTDPANLSLLRDLETRVRSMALVHESLYLSDDLNHVNLEQYTKTLTQYIFQMYRAGPGIRCRIDVGDISMPIETAIPFGLVMNEIVTNALKHAFPASFSCMDERGEACTVAVSLHREGNDYLLTISDNGVGLPEEIDIAGSRSLGLYLIRFIVGHQLRGKLDISRAGGTSYTIRFPEPADQRRIPYEKV